MISSHHKHKLIFSVVLILLTFVTCTYANNSVSVTFVNEAAAIAANGQSKPMLFTGQQAIISSSSFSPQNNTIKMPPYSGNSQLLQPGVNYYSGTGPRGPGNYELYCHGPGASYPTMIDTRFGGSATITILTFTTQPTFEITCSCAGTACGTDVKKT